MMQRVTLEPQLKTEPLDEATLKAVEEARTAVRRGETVTLEQSTEDLRKEVKAWRKTQEKSLAA